MDDLYRIEYGHWAASPYGRSVFKALNATPFGLPEPAALAVAISANAALPKGQKDRYRAAKITGIGHTQSDLPMVGDYYKAFGVPCRVEEVHVQPDSALRRTGYAMVAVKFRYCEGLSAWTHPVGLDEFRKFYKRDLNPFDRIHLPKAGGRSGRQKPWHELKIGRPTGAEIPAVPKARVDKQAMEFAAEMKTAMGRMGVSRDTDGPFFTKYEGGVPVTRDAADATFAKLCDGLIPMSSRYHQPAFHSTDQADALGPVTFTGNIPPKPPPTPKVEPKPGQVWRRVKPDSVYLGQEWTVRRACSGGFSFAPLLGRRGTVWTRLSNIHRHWEFVRETEKPSVFMWLGGDGEV
jgi:hypothetical protein